MSAKVEAFIQQHKLKILEKTGYTDRYKCRKMKDVSTLVDFKNQINAIILEKEKDNMIKLIEKSEGMDYKNDAEIRKKINSATTRDEFDKIIKELFKTNQKLGLFKTKVVFNHEKIDFLRKLQSCSKEIGEDDYIKLYNEIDSWDEKEFNTELLFREKLLMLHNKIDQCKITEDSKELNDKLSSTIKNITEKKVFSEFVEKANKILNESALDANGKKKCINAYMRTCHSIIRFLNGRYHDSTNIITEKFNRLLTYISQLEDKKKEVQIRNDILLDLHTNILKTQKRPIKIQNK